MVLLNYLGCYFGLHPYLQIKLIEEFYKSKFDILELSCRLQTMVTCSVRLSLSLVYLPRKSDV